MVGLLDVPGEQELPVPRVIGCRSASGGCHRASGLPPGASCVVFLIGVALLGAGCAPRASVGTRAPDRSACTATVTSRAFASVERAITRAGPGDVVCLGGGAYGSRRIDVATSGTAHAPLEIRAAGRVTVGGFRVRADHVTIRGFDITTVPSAGSEVAPGVSLRGTGIVVIGNRIHDTNGDGIACEFVRPSCIDVVIADNLIRHADGTGIVVFGKNDRVERNDVSGSVRVHANDADGIRFFGTGHVLRDNRIHDISASGYASDPPHTDCFQTFDNGKPRTANIVIDRNVCENVDDQCLIATAQQSGTEGRIGRSHTVRFTNNVCHTAGSQALLIEQFPGVTVSRNVFSDTIRYRAAIFLDGSIDGAFVDNIVNGDLLAYELDTSSARGFRAARNMRRGGTAAAPTQPGFVP
jgi:hypothetical protein